MFKIAFSGAQNCGKTTKSRFFYFSCLQMGLKTELVEETARMCPFPLDDKADFKTQDWITRKQMALEFEIKSKNPDIMVCDRSILDPLIYSKFLFELGKMTDGDLDIIRNRVLEWIHTYDAIVLCREYPMVNDGVRSIDEKAQIHINDLFDETVVELGLKNIRRT